MVCCPVPERTDHAGSVEYTGAGCVVCTDCHLHWYDCLYCHAIHEAYQPYDPYGNHKYSHAERRDCYRYEAALDLGASQTYAFFKVVFPDILPGILSGFPMAFTMSLDDFIITHFTKGPGVDTLSTKIYTEVKKGIKPEMYALSTIIFVTVLVLLLLVNYMPMAKKKK